ncbi:YqaJ viral recombinase family protein [Virgibacillus salexigens]|uniref:YqaJ-like viral recombinase domain protein n=1 Tax=Virgibacillus massiliensis TaxID=1462526 RepID=A0A024QAH0_9BACI|nr:YqaJ viral recombinase family protein [Virgibacillus massiliensis]CDQ39503.1 YqaJ-like viral recombinase domain protein [Virgibacillus massiliensis]
MITSTNDRHNFIGGSEANMIYMNYESKTFVDWWSKKLVGVTDETFTNINMAVGTLLESDVIDLYESIHGVKGIRDKQKVKGIARANTDYIINDKVSDVKVTAKAFEWFIKEKVPINYKRQLIHYLYIFELSKASIIAYQVNEDLFVDPFQDLSEDMIYEIEVNITPKEIQTHREKLDYLEYCKEINIFPQQVTK